MASHHARSNSFPSRQHPLIAEIDEQLRRWRSSQEASSSASIVSKLSGLEDLHDCADQLLSQPRNIQSLCKEETRNRVGEILDGSLRILDICSISTNALSQMKESVQELQSILRRRRGDELDLTTAVKKFLASRKIIQKAMKKGFKTNNKEVKNDEIVALLGEIESTAITVLESMFSFISGPKSQKSSNWSLVSKLVSSKRIVCEEVNEFEIGVASLQSLISRNKKPSETAQNKLHKLENCIEDLEDAVESLSKRLIKSRVSLLNIFSH